MGYKSDHHMSRYEMTSEFHSRNSDRLKSPGLSLPALGHAAASFGRCSCLVWAVQPPGLGDAAAWFWPYSCLVWVMQLHGLDRTTAWIWP